MSYEVGDMFHPDCKRQADLSKCNVEMEIFESGVCAFCGSSITASGQCYVVSSGESLAEFV